MDPRLYKINIKQDRLFENDLDNILIIQNHYQYIDGDHKKFVHVEKNDHLILKKIKNNLHIQYNLPDDEFVYLIFDTICVSNDISLDAKKVIYNICVHTDDNLQLFLVIYFYDQNFCQIKSGLYDVNGHDFSVPKNCKYLKFGLRIRKVGYFVLHNIYFTYYDKQSNYFFEHNNTIYRFIVSNLEQKIHGVIIFLASTKPPDMHPPVYSRATWSSDLSEFCTIAVADPFEADSNAMQAHGSWYINSDGESCLPDIALGIKTILKNDYGQILCYGSSMGGYGSLLLAYYLQADYCVAENPQINLLKYPSSLQYLSSLSKYNHKIVNIFHYFQYIKKIYIYLCIGDFHHIRHLTEQLKESNLDILRKIHSIKIIICNDFSTLGHTPFLKEKALAIIRKIFLSD